MRDRVVAEDLPERSLKYSEGYPEGVTRRHGLERQLFQYVLMHGLRVLVTLAAQSNGEKANLFLGRDQAVAASSAQTAPAVPLPFAQEFFLV